MAKRNNRVKTTNDLELKDRLVAINRVTKVTKGGRTFTFAAIVVVGNGDGIVGNDGTGYDDNNNDNMVDDAIDDTQNAMDDAVDDVTGNKNNRNNTNNTNNNTGNGQTSGNVTTKNNPTADNNAR